ncbi:MAG: hypothetical protein JO119_14575, partial [Acidobacteria bacterium]|nr:hypothetical protein [Acidobacteriota bacterium]
QFGAQLRRGLAPLRNFRRTFCDERAPWCDDRLTHCRTWRRSNFDLVYARSKSDRGSSAQLLDGVALSSAALRAAFRLLFRPRRRQFQQQQWRTLRRLLRRKLKLIGFPQRLRQLIERLKFRRPRPLIQNPKEAVSIEKGSPLRRPFLFRHKTSDRSAIHLLINAVSEEAK